MIVILIGLSTNLAVQLSKDTYGFYQSTNWAWGFGVIIGIYIAGGISGGHLNPAIPLTPCLYRGFPFRKALIYVSAQVPGAFLAALVASLSIATPFLLTMQQAVPKGVQPVYTLAVAARHFSHNLHPSQALEPVSQMNLSQPQSSLARFSPWEMTPMPHPAQACTPSSSASSSPY
jgi:glycerol uptake facilitator-like aquaporin